MALLEAERITLETEHDELQSATLRDADRARELAVNEERLAALVDRMVSAEVTELPAAPLTTVMFGCTVTLLTLTGRFAGEENRFTITGVDEADAASGLVAFTAPLVQAILGQAAGDEVTLKIGSGEQKLRILEIERPAGEE
jgi:transcription elongation factor GreB